MEVRILYLQKTKEKYIFLYRPGREMEAISGLIRLAHEPHLSVSWGDVHLVARELLATGAPKRARSPSPGACQR